MKTNRLSLRIGFAGLVIGTFVLASGFAYGADLPLPDASVPAPNLSLESATEGAGEPVTEFVAELPIDPTGAQPPGGDAIGPVEDALPPGVLPGGGLDNGTGGTSGGTGGTGGTGGGGTGGTGGGGGTGGLGITSGTLGGDASTSVGRAGARHTLLDPAGGTKAGLSARREYEDRFGVGEVAGRAMQLAAPMAAPVGIAVAGVLGLVMMAKSNGRLDALHDEKEALGGWTVIRL